MAEIFDCAIIGDGPAGLSAAINFVQRGCTCVVFGLGHSLLQKAEKMDNYLGMPSLTGKVMYGAFVAHAKNSGVPIHHAKVSNIMPMSNGFMVNADSEIYSAKTILLAMGAARATAITGENELLGKGVSYCATCDGMLYRGKEIIVWALGQEALQEAEFLHSIGCKVTLVATKAPQTLPEGMQFIQGTLASVQGESTVTGAVINKADKTQTELSAQGVFILRDAVAPSALVNGIATEGGRILVNEHFATNIPNIYAAGDITGTPLQVSKAVGDGQIAALYIAEHLK